MKNLTWQNPGQLFVAQELIKIVKLKCCGIKDIFGCSNASSMCVYSGCTHNTYLHSFEGHFLFAYNIYEDIFVNREGCLYTGDSILHNSNKLSFIISKLNKRNIHIGTLQIPHHGSFRNLDEGALDEMEAKGIKPNIFFASYGTKKQVSPSFKSSNEND